MTSNYAILAQATVPNGRWGDHHVSVQRRGDEIQYRDGFSDPLVCDDFEQAMRFFNERLARDLPSQSS